MQVFCDNYVENQALYHTFTEPLFLKPDGVRTRYPIGWNGYGRYLPNTLKVTYNGLPCNISEESNGIWFNFDIAPGANTNYEDYTISYVARPLDYAFSVGLPEGGYTGEEYFLFPNWNNAKGEGDGFWVGKWQASNNGSDIPQSKSNTTYLWAGITRDNAINQCRAKGENFGMMRNRQWVSIALWCDHHEIYIKGNIYGGNTNNLDGDNTTLTQCGGGYHGGNGYHIVTGNTVPDTWSHNGKSGGIYNLNGNVWEFMDGIENRGGEIWIYDENGNYVDSGVSIAASVSGTGTQIKDISNTSEAILNEGISNIIDTQGYVPSNLKGDAMWNNNGGQNVLIRSGCSYYGLQCGLWTFSVLNPLSVSGWELCFRLTKDLE